MAAQVHQALESTRLDLLAHGQLVPYVAADLQPEFVPFVQSGQGLENDLQPPIGTEMAENDEAAGVIAPRLVFGPVCLARLGNVGQRGIHNWRTVIRTKGL